MLLKYGFWSLLFSGATVFCINKLLVKNLVQATQTYSFFVLPTLGLATFFVASKKFNDYLQSREKELKFDKVFEVLLEFETKVNRQNVKDKVIEAYKECKELEVSKVEFLVVVHKCLKDLERINTVTNFNAIKTYLKDEK